MVEFALVALLLCIIVFGIIEFGRIFNAKLIITNAAREGARAGVVAPPLTDSTDYRTPAITNAVISKGASLGLTSGNITITSEPYTDYVTAPRGNQLKVTVDYNVTLLVPIVSSLISDDDNFPLSASSVMRIE